MECHFYLKEWLTGKLYTSYLHLSVSELPKSNLRYDHGSENPVTFQQRILQITGEHFTWGILGII